MFFTYLRRELRRRMRQAIFIALGLALGVGLVITVTAASAGVDRFITVNGLRLHYLDWGSPDKQPFLMLHGIGRVAHSFDHIAPRFNQDYHVIAIDMRGHGDSAWSPDGDYTPHAFVYDFSQLIETLGYDEVSIVGHSLGGMITTLYTGLYPERVRRFSTSHSMRSRS